MSEIRVNDTVIHYEIEKNIIGAKLVNEVTITGAASVGSLLEIPAEIEGMKVTKFDKKALVGKKNLRELIIPPTVRLLENWSIAQCDSLKKVVIGNPQAWFGKGVFDESSSLEFVYTGANDTTEHAALLAKTPCVMEAEYLLNERYSGYDEWYANWDSRLNSIINEADDEGYTALVLCGEEDILKNPTEFCRDNRKKKSYLCLLRLFYNSALSDENEKIFTEYILSHCKGCETDEAWQVLLERFADDIRFFKMFADLGGITAENVDDMLLDMDENHAEAKAYVMDYKQEKFAGARDVFDMFEL